MFQCIQAETEKKEHAQHHCHLDEIARLKTNVEQFVLCEHSKHQPNLSEMRQIQQQQSTILQYEQRMISSMPSEL